MDKKQNIIEWKDWSPGLDNDHLTLREVKATLPGNSQAEINGIVKLFENPASPIAFTGAVTLERHDCIHILLGRGLLNQDEAFVIGFTMGTAKEELTDMDVFLFKQVARYLYPGPYRFRQEHIKAFELGLTLGKEGKTDKIYRYPIEEYMDAKLGDLRSLLGIDVRVLKKIYKLERKLLPETTGSARLPI